MGCLLPGCMAPSRGSLEDRHGSAYPRQCNGQAGESAGCESRSRHFRISGVCCAVTASVHYSGGASWGDSARFCLSSLRACRRKVHVSFVQASSHAPAWVKWTPPHAGRRPCPCPPGRLAAQEGRHSPPGHHSHIPVDSGNRLGLVLLDFASSQLSTRFASELPRCPETCRSRQATRQTVPVRRLRLISRL